MFMPLLARRISLWLILAWLGNCFALLVAAAIVPAISYGDDLGTLLFAGAILGIVNFALRPVIVLMTLPAVILSLGVALLFINALMLWVTSGIVPGLYVGGFGSTLAGALAIWLSNMALRNWRRGAQQKPTIRQGPPRVTDYDYPSAR
jgi:putative membrane protein